LKEERREKSKRLGNAEEEQKMKRGKKPNADMNA